MDQWLGSSYRVDAKGAQSKVGPSVAAIEWPDVKRVLTGPHSIRLSPLEKSGKTDAFRGVLLRTQAENHAAVLEFVAANCPEESVFQEVASETV